MSARRITALTAAALASGLALTATPATAAKPVGDRSLATVLAADGNRFDHNADDFDIVHRAVTTVLGAKPGSAVGVLADGDTKLTAFLPTDGAFRHLVRDLTGERTRSEKAVFTTVATLGVDTIETVLLYHVVPGATITYAQAKRADGAKLQTAAGAAVTVNITTKGRVALRDLDRNDKNARVILDAKNINKGNKQIAHGITQVLRPADL